MKNEGKIQAEFCYRQGQLLKAKREQRRITQSDLGRAVGVHRNSICRWETGDCEISTWMLLRLADALSCNHLLLLPERKYVWGADYMPTLREGLPSAKAVALERDPGLVWMGATKARPA